METQIREMLLNQVIVSEKNNVAKRIADILSAGSAKVEQVKKVPVYTFKRNGNDVRCVGLRGHILRVDFPSEYSKWEAVDPVSLIDAHIVKVPITKSLVSLLEKEAKAADQVVVATDFDREGEVIGLDAANIMTEANGKLKVKRARFSALTNQEITGAFDKLEDVYEDLAHAGEARQDIDLIWGATLTRFFSLAATRLGKSFLSVGRVQSPTLSLIAEKDAEVQAFKAKPFWVISGIFNQAGEEFEAFHKVDKFWAEKEAEAVFKKLKGPGTVAAVKEHDTRIRPPAPFNTTTFLTQAASRGIPPAQAMITAENLYNSGFISYPRVDNTVYPKSLDFRGILANLERSEFGGLARELLAKKTLTPTRGKKETTDHPPIHPTGVPSRGSLSTRQWNVYELVCRRFMATLADEAIMKHVKVDFDVDGESFLLKGSTVAREGWYRFYHYSRKKDEEIPLFKEADTVELVKPVLSAKETQPPPRYGQGSLIREMEKLGLGTKSTRHLIIQNLIDRGYAHGDPLRPSETGRKVAGALKKYAHQMASPEMTAELEKEMDRIAKAETEWGTVVDKSRQMLAAVMVALQDRKDQVAEEIKEGIYGDKLVGKCPKCDSNLKIIRAKKSRKRFVGCESYPDCSVSYPLPQFGEVIALGENCDQCGSPRIKVVAKKKRPWELCLDPDCPTKDAYKSKKKRAGKTTPAKSRTKKKAAQKAGKA